MAENYRFDPFEISALIVRHISGDISLAEEAKLKDWLQADPRNVALLESLQDKHLWRREIAGMNAFDTELALRNVLDKINYQPKSRQRKLWPTRYIAAAVVLICLSFSSWFLKNKNQKTLERSKTAAVQTAPAEKIMLTLSDGRKVDLSGSATDTLINQGSANIKKHNNLLSYESKAGATANAEQIYNTLRIPEGYQYQVILPDGSGVWLNAGSTLRFPVAFNSKERIVELSGEAYFEVKHESGKPFSVKSATQTVQVLGTHFNVQAYPEDTAAITTLAEGSVRIDNGKSSLKLKPGQMVVNTSQNTLIPKEARLNESLAWTQGRFSFSDDRLEDIMKKVARRYHLEVEFHGEVKDQRFWGTYPIDKGLSNLLKNLEQTHTVRFRLDGRRVIVSQ